ncbi:hypothetical protein AGMMS49982_01800 [Bacteroidia bacterium]|nr:hypothetical protein AGMMS49982_01800 [Bacteroidia bacterium]
MSINPKIPVTENGKNAIQASIKSASEQKVPEALIYLDKNYAMTDVWAGLKAALQDGRAKTLTTIIIRFYTGEIKRYDVDKLRLVFKGKGKTT